MLRENVQLISLDFRQKVVFCIFLAYTSLNYQQEAYKNYISTESPEITHTASTSVDFFGVVFQTTATLYIREDQECLITEAVGVSGLCRCLCQQHILPHLVGSRISVQGKTQPHKGAGQAADGKLGQLSMASCCSLQSNG